MKKNYLKELNILFLSLLVSITTYAQLGTDVYNLGADNANNYGSGWNESTAGTGFSDWTFDTSTPSGGFAGRFIGSFSSDLDVSGNSFGLFANSGNNATSGVTVNFPKTMEEGDVFKISVGVNFRDGNKGFDLRNSSNTTIKNFNVAGDKYTLDGTDLYSDAYDANTVITFTFTQNASDMSWVAVRTGGLTGSESGTFAGVTPNTVTNIRLYNVSAGTNGDGGSGQRNLYFNSLEFTSLYSINNNSSVTISTNTTVPYLNVESGSSVNINSGVSLIVNGSSTGNVTYNQTLGSTNWYLMSSPVSGVTFNDTFVGDNNIDDTNGSGNNRGVASYLTASNTWSYLQSLGSMSADSGTGYSVKQDVAGTVSFTGTINTADVNANIATTGNGFNLVGNPFAAHINAKTFLDANSNLDQTQLWVWNQASGMYEVKTNESGFILAPTQGFFVKANSGTQVTFAATNQEASGGTFQKSANTTELTLFMTDGDKNRFAKIYYAETATKGFDYGWEGEVFGGVPNSLDVYTNLIDENQGKKYQVQSLPKNEMESMVIPVGVIAEAGEIEFSAESINLPAGLKVFLEDRTTNTFTRLDEANASYKVTLSEKTNEIGRFYLHTKSAALSTDSVELSNINMYTTNSTTLRIVGLSKGQASLKIFNILGKQVLETTFNSNGVYDVNLPALNTGVYIAQLENDNGKINKKIVLE